jgi:hypothetical protein
MAAVPADAPRRWLGFRRPEKLKDVDRVYVEDETVAPEAPLAAEPA